MNKLKPEQILKKAIEKAVKNGYDWKKNHAGPAEPYVFEEWAKRSMVFRDWANLIFSHDFAIAFWGKTSIDCDCSHECECKCFMCKEGWEGYETHEIHQWEHHLQQMVIFKDPILYLKKFI